MDSTNAAFSKLQILHNQLTLEYEEQLKQKDSLKNDLKEARFSLKEKLTQLKSVETKLKRENEQFKAELMAVKHLPAEHAKLKVEISFYTINHHKLIIFFFVRMILEHYLQQMKNLKLILEMDWMLRN